MIIGCNWSLWKKAIMDKTIAIKEYARQTKNRSLEIDAAEIRMRAERRLGQMLKEQKDQGKLKTGGDRKSEES